MREVPQEAVAFVQRIDQPGHLADIVVYGPAFEFEDELDLLNTFDPIERLEKVQVELSRQLELLRLRAKIQSDTKDALDQSQKEYFLREQMKAIRRELGEDDLDEDPIDELQAQDRRAAGARLCQRSGHARAKRLAQQGMNSPEAGVIRTYLDWLLALPWAREEQLPDLARPKRARCSTKTTTGWRRSRSACWSTWPCASWPVTRCARRSCALVGPPGVGKTSLGRSIARALGRQFVRTIAGRRARRSRDPRPSAHLYRRDARPRSSRACKTAKTQSAGLYARRDRQAWRGFPRRPDFGAARGARS